MDPVSMARSAFDILKKLKEELKAAEEAFEEARDFRQHVESLEIIVMMIPNNDKQTKEKISNGEKKTHGKIKEAITHGNKELEQKLLDMTGLGQIVDLINLQSGGDVEPIYSQDEIRPAEVLRSMKRCKEFSKMDIMFQGMSFILSDAIRAIDNGTVTLREMQDIGPPKWWWKCLMPWNFDKIMELKGHLEMHRLNLSKKIESLQAAIGVASYTVQLEQLESVLDATSAFHHSDMKMMWKKKIGSDKARVSINEFFEAFMSFLEGESLINKEIKETLSKQSSREKIDDKTAPNLSHLRFLNYIFNENNDEYLSVYEANHRLCLFGDRAPKHSSLQFVFDFILKQEENFKEKVKFTLIHLFNRAQDSEEPSEMIPERVDCKEVLKVRPFHRALILCELPLFDPDVYEFDCVTLLKYKSPINPTETKRIKSKFDILEDCPSMRCMVSKKNSNLKFNGEDDKYGNASYGKLASKLAKSLNVPRENWHIFSYKNNTYKMTESKSAAELEVDNYDANYGILPLNTGCKLLYSPIVVKAGFYTPRYCFTGVEVGALGFDQHFVKQYNKSMKSYFADCGAKENSSNIAEGRDDKGSNTNTKPNEKPGPLIECLDVMEIVFGVCRDPETYTSDEKGGGEDEYEIERKIDWIPYLSERFPYLPERVLTFPSDDFPQNNEEGDDEDENPYGIPDELAVFVNFPKKKKSSEKHSAALDYGNITNENKNGKTTEFSCRSFGIFSKSKSEDSNNATFELLPKCEYQLEDLKKDGNYGNHLIINLRKIIYKHLEQKKASKSYVICFIKDFSGDPVPLFDGVPYLEFNLDDDAIVSSDNEENSASTADEKEEEEEEEDVVDSDENDDHAEPVEEEVTDEIDAKADHLKAEAVVENDEEENGAFNISDDDDTEGVGSRGPTTGSNKVHPVSPKAANFYKI